MGWSELLAALSQLPCLAHINAMSGNDAMRNLLRCGRDLHLTRCSFSASSLQAKFLPAFQDLQRAHSSNVRHFHGGSRLGLLFRTPNNMEACFLTFLAHDSEILEERIDKGRSSDNFANLTRLSDAAPGALKHGFITSFFLPSASALLYAYKVPRHTGSLIPWIGIP